MKNILSGILKVISPITLLGWIIPKTMAAYEAWQSNKIAENAVAMVETAALELAQDFDPALVPEITEYEAAAGPAVTAVIEAIEHPGLNADEVALTSVIVAFAKARHSSVDPAKLQESVATLCQLVNEGISGTAQPTA